VPALWLDLFATEAAAWAAGASYLAIVGPVLLFQGVGLALYFASPGAGTVVWPVVATVPRFVVAVGLVWIGVHHFDRPLEFLYGCIAAGMVLYGVITAGSVRLGVWCRGARATR
jgi:Na+-driven multidrug efflux pump